ncbi:hypothetical protein AURDEDRAFT_130648 [Auricularia subglabra TFB-10046 SS5]|uniref:Uncharacterized protein n=1 Tax=Auricularia subglabra (strain TFB-10046 / SS5) TaxID=717982 RepID=J0D891_AURST|nr:hypothetical protein AURDEDRAFT_130648 [Auricularia subglabra TFB-10046 SS5]
MASPTSLSWPSPPGESASLRRRQSRAVAAAAHDCPFRRPLLNGSAPGRRCDPDVANANIAEPVCALCRQNDIRCDSAGSGAKRAGQVNVNLALALQHAAYARALCGSCSKLDLRAANAAEYRRSRTRTKHCNALAAEWKADVETLHYAVTQLASVRALEYTFASAQLRRLDAGALARGQSDIPCARQIPPPPQGFMQLLAALESELARREGGWQAAARTCYKPAALAGGALQCHVQAQCGRRRRNKQDGLHQSETSHLKGLLFSHGERATVDTLLDYRERYISAGLLDVVSVMLVLARPVVFPLLAADATRARLVAVVASACARRGSCDGAATERATNFLNLVAGSGALPRDEAQFVAGHEAALPAAIAPVIERMPEMHRLFEWLASWCATMARRTDVEPPPRIARRYAQYQGTARAREACVLRASRPHLVHEIVVQAIGRRVCAGPRCGRSVLQDAEGSGAWSGFPPQKRRQSREYQSRRRDTAPPYLRATFSSV